MAFLDDIREALQSAGEAPWRARYGVGPEEKARMVLQGQIPGAPPANAAENPLADRYASTYLGTKKWGSFLPQVMNAIALDDIGSMMRGDWKEAVRRKHYGELGIERGLRER